MEGGTMYEVDSRDTDMGVIDPWLDAQDILGYPGAMLSGSKTAPANQTVVWNANVVMEKDEKFTKVWFGDLNLTRRKDDLLKLAQTLDAAVYVLYEMDARFEYENDPRIDNYRFLCTPDGSWLAPKEVIV
jgi:hypothetical protein